MKSRFEVSSEGMKGLHEGRPLWSLVKELVANVWDEPTATECKVTIADDATWTGDEGNTGGKLIHVVVEDDGEGFADVTDAYTLMAPTNKRNDSETRGRFNIGEKEIISIAYWAEVETVGTTIVFPIEGGRLVKKNKRTKGTTVTAYIERSTEEIAETVDRLLEFLPPADKQYTVNGEEVIRPKKIATVSASRLLTIIATGSGEPLRRTGRTTDIDIYEPIRGVGRIYEMGILIQEVEAPYSIDIQQKVPMPPNRDTVTSYYLQDVYAHVLNAVAKDLKQSEVSEAWVQMGVEDKRSTDETVQLVMRVKLGETAVLWSSDIQANENAHAHGFDVIAPRTLSKMERERFRDVGLKSASDNFGHKSDEGIDGVGIQEIEAHKITTEMLIVEEYAQRISDALLGFRCKVRFVKNKGLGDGVAAQYGNKTLDFLYQRLGYKWFNQANQMAQLEVILHELAHEGMSKTPHTGEFVERGFAMSAYAIVLMERQLKNPLDNRFPRYDDVVREFAMWEAEAEKSKVK